MLVAAQKTFELIAIEIAEHLDKRNIKTLEIKDYQQTLDEALLNDRIKQTTGRSMGSTITTVLEEGADSTRRTLGYGFGLTNEEAVKYAKTHTNRLSGSIAKTSVRDVRETIAKGISEGKDLRKVRAELMEKVEGWSEARAETVARTETLTAANQGSLAIMQKAGIEYKQWLAAPDACAHCKALSEQVSAMSEDYMMDDHSMNIAEKTRPGYVGTNTRENSYGDMPTPPIHPRCRCTIAGIPASEVQEDGADFSGKFENQNKDYNELTSLTKRMQEMGYQYDDIVRVTNKAVIENIKHGLPANVKIIKFQDRISVIINGSNVTPALQKVWGASHGTVGKILHMPLEGGVEAYQKTRLMLTQSGKIPVTNYQFSSQVPGKHVKEIKAAFGDLERKYGPVTDRITDVGSLAYSGPDKPPIAYTQRVAGGNRIVFVEENWGVSEKTVDKMLTNSFDNKWTATPGARGVTNHEFGHRVDDYLSRIKGVNTALPYPRGDFISGVAELSSSQEFAEVFALYESGLAPGNLQVQAMMELLKKGGLLP